MKIMNWELRKLLLSAYPFAIAKINDILQQRLFVLGCLESEKLKAVCKGIENINSTQNARHVTCKLIHTTRRMQLVACRSELFLVNFLIFNHPRTVSPV